MTNPSERVFEAVASEIAATRVLDWMIENQWVDTNDHFYDNQERLVERLGVVIEAVYSNPSELRAIADAIEAGK